MLVGCGAPGPVSVVGAHPVGVAATVECARLVNTLPASVDGQSQRDITPSNASGAAWGDPAIVLRCGVDRPAALRRTSLCFEVNHVGWLATQDGKAVPMTGPVDGTVEFTTIGRSVYVELSVPGAYQPQGDALVSVAAAVKSSTRDPHPCH